MNDGDALLRAVLAAPDDDAPRLIYADWLDENGEPERAEFIRVQCELARMVGPDPKCNTLDRSGIHSTTMGLVACGKCWPIRDALRRRERELWTGNLLENRPPLKMELPDASEIEIECLLADFPNSPTNMTNARPKVFVRRGFVHSVTCTAADCLAHLDTIRERHPVREVRLTTWPGATWEPLGGNMVKSVLTGNETDVPALLGWDRRDGINRLLAHHWPGITFHLPSRAEYDVVAFDAERLTALPVGWTATQLRPG